MQWILNRRFLRFCLVGGSGLAVDCALFLLLNPILPNLTARILAFWGAASWNWLCNRRFTFASRSSALQQWHRYVMVAIVGFVPNIGTFWLLTTITPLQHWPVIALALGSLAGLLCNYHMASQLVFKK